MSRLLQKVPLLKHHEHRGKMYEPGESIELRPEQIKVLRVAGVVKAQQATRKRKK